VNLPERRQGAAVRREENGQVCERGWLAAREKPSPKGEALKGKVTRVRLMEEGKKGDRS